jgi:fatty-acid desaturase
MFYTEMVNSFFHLYGCGYHYNRINATPLVASTLVVVDDPVAMC